VGLKFRPALSSVAVRFVKFFSFIAIIMTNWQSPSVISTEAPQARASFCLSYQIYEVHAQFSTAI
jgi:hypothetical protein